MRLAVLTFDFPPAIGGVQTYLYEVARRLSRWHDVAVITPVASAGSHEADIRRLKPSPGNAIGYWRALHRLRPDRVLLGHAHPQLLAAAAAYRHTSYAAIAYGNDYLAAQNRWHRTMFNRLLAHARPLVSISDANARRLQRLGLPKPLVIYPGTDQDRFKPSRVRPSRPLVLLTVGRLVPRKGIDTALRSLQRVIAVVPDVEYRIVGVGPDDVRLRALADELGIASSVKFLGRVPADDLPATYRNAHIYVMPAREEARGASVEGFGIVYLEASASGLPVIAGRSGGAAEAVLDGHTGYLVEPNDAKALSAILIRLLEDEGLRRKLGARGRQWVEDEMNWDRAAQQLANALALLYG